MARSINGVSFNGTADITVTAAAGTLSGATLASGVTASSLTSVGTLGTLTVTGNIIGIGALVAGGGSLDRLGIQGLTPGSGSLINSTNAAANAFAPLTFDATVQKFNIASTERMRLDAYGNLGLGATPDSGWSGLSESVLVGKYWNIHQAGQNSISFDQNTYYNAGFKYLNSFQASRYTQAQGTHAWYTAPSGTAGNAIGFTQRMTLDASGNLLVGDISNGYGAANRGLVEINGTNDSLLGFKVASSPKGYVGHSGTDLSIANQVAGNIYFTTNNVSRWAMNSTGHFLANVDATYDIGASGANRPRSIYATASINVGPVPSSYLLSSIAVGGADRTLLQAGVNAVSNGLTVDWHHSTLKTRVRIVDIPTSAAGLPTGTIWSNAGVLNIA
jgi:hypothetical protein